MNTDRAATRPGGSAVVNMARRYAAIVDLENVAIVSEGRVCQAEMQALLEAIRPHVVGLPVRVATGAKILAAYMEIPELKTWGLTLVKTEPDAADHALCDAARDFIRSGVTDIVVVGGDHAYVPLAANARLHVISHADHLSRTLRLAATTVSYLPDLRHTALTAS